MTGPREIHRLGGITEGTGGVRRAVIRMEIIEGIIKSPLEVIPSVLGSLEWGNATTAFVYLPDPFSLALHIALQSRVHLELEEDFASYFISIIHPVVYSNYWPLATIQSTVQLPLDHFPFPKQGKQSTRFVNRCSRTSALLSRVT